MKKLSVALVGATLILLGAGRGAQAATVTFEDVPRDASMQNQGIIPNGYAGFNWNNFNYINTSTAAPSGYKNAATSGTYVAYNAYGEMAILSNSVFDFNSVNLTAVANDGLLITVEGLKNGAVLYSNQNNPLSVNTTGPTVFNTPYLGIDELRFTSSGGTKNPAFTSVNGTQFAMDDLIFNNVAVPTPSSALSTLAFGALSAGYLLRRKLKTQK